MADRTVLLALLYLLLAAPAGAGCWLAWRLLRRLTPAAGHAVHDAWEWATAWVLVAITAAGPLDADPDTYAARSAALSPLYSDSTTTGGPR